MRQTEAGRLDAVEQLRDLDRKIELRRRLIRELETQATQSRRRADDLQKSIREHEDQILLLSQRLAAEQTQLSALREEMGRRLAYLYRRSAYAKPTFLLGAADLADLAARARYVQAVEKLDRRRLDALRRRRDQVVATRQSEEEVKASLAAERRRKLAELAEIQNLLAERRREEQLLDQERRAKDALRRKIASDAELIQALLDERRQALRAIEQEILRMEARPESGPAWSPDVPFAELYGRLPWPLKKHVVTQPFGTIRHPRFGTVTENPGLDLAASPGEPVFAAAAGRVAKVAYLRGFGNTLILEHGGGYFTVYARLGRIFASEGQTVQAGQVLAEVGDTGAEGDFHFEIWKNRDKMNPALWLRK